MVTKYSLKKIQELAASYALGALEDRESQMFKKLLEEGPNSSETELKSFKEVVDLFGFGAYLVNPPSDLEERLLSKVREKRGGIERSLEKSPGFLHGPLRGRRVERDRRWR